MQDYKPLRIAVMICATLVNTQTHIQLLTGYTISSAHRFLKRRRKTIGYVKLYW